MKPSADKHVHSSSTAASSGITSPVMSTPDAPGAALWEAEGAQNSIMLPYVRDHGDKMIARTRQEDPRVHFLALKQVHDVCLYKRLTQPQDALNAAMVNASSYPLGASLSSSFSSLGSSSRRGLSLTRDPTEGVHVPGDLEFRGITRVPGNVDTILDFLASESARENYWVALNTLKDVKAAALLSTARLRSQSHSATSITSETDGDTTAFPRWSRKYTATKFSKHSAHVMDCCYAEYATRCDETNIEGHARQRGFVYRRSVSEHALSNASSVSSEPLAKARVEGAARFFIRDWLFDVIETQDPFVCKLVLTCTVFAPPPPGRAAGVSRTDFREFCTELMVGARRALTHQWKDHAAHAGVRASSSWRRETRCCTVCSTQFSLLRKRHTCRSCGSGVCSRCCLKSSDAPKAPSVNADAFRNGFGSTSVASARPKQRGQYKRECLLCAKFGPDSGLDAPRASGVVTRSRHLSTSMNPLAASSSRGFTTSSRGMLFETEQEESDQVHPDLDMRSTTSVSGSRRQRSQRSIGSVGSQRSISGPDDDDDESDEDVRPYTPRLDLRATASKLRTISTDSSSMARSAPGVVLLSDLETLTLSGSFHRAASMSARSSASLSVSLYAQSPGNAASRVAAKSSAPTPAALRAQQPQQRQDRAASEDNVVLMGVKPRARDGPQESSATSTEEEEEVYEEDDLANFTLKLL